MEEKNNGSTYHIRNWPRSKCEDELASVRHNILVKISRMSNDWLAIVELNKRKERIQARLEETGVRIKDQ